MKIQKYDAPVLMLYLLLRQEGSLNRLTKAYLLKKRLGYYWIEFALFNIFHTIFCAKVRL